MLIYHQGTGQFKLICDWITMANNTLQCVCLILATLFYVITHLYDAARCSNNNIGKYHFSFMTFVTIDNPSSFWLMHACIYVHTIYTPKTPIAKYLTEKISLWLNGCSRLAERFYQSKIGL